MNCNDYNSRKNVNRLAFCTQAVKDHNKTSYWLFFMVKWNFHFQIIYYTVYIVNQKMKSNRTQFVISIILFRNAFIFSIFLIKEIRWDEESLFDFYFCWVVKIFWWKIHSDNLNFRTQEKTIRYLWLSYIRETITIGTIAQTGEPRVKTSGYGNFWQNNSFFARRKWQHNHYQNSVINVWLISKPKINQWLYIFALLFIAGD